MLIRDIIMTKLKTFYSHINHVVCSLIYNFNSNFTCEGEENLIITVYKMQGLEISYIMNGCFTCVYDDIAESGSCFFLCSWVSMVFQEISGVVFSMVEIWVMLFLH